MLDVLKHKSDFQRFFKKVQSLGGSNTANSSLRSQLGLIKKLKEVRGTGTIDWSMLPPSLLLALLLHRVQWWRWMQFKAELAGYVNEPVRFRPRPIPYHRDHPSSGVEAAACLF